MQPGLLLATAAFCGFLAGALLSRLGSAARRPLGRRADELHHRIRALEADLRVAQRNAEQARSEHQTGIETLAENGSELSTLRERCETQEQQLRKLRGEIQHESSKVARLRQELADRAEEMVRTHVQLRDVQNELGVTQVGSDVVIERIVRLERERDDLTAMVEGLRREMAERPQSRTSGGGDDAVMDC